MDLGRRYEFHTHTFYSDGVLSVAELLRYGEVRDCAVLAVCDHVDFSNVEHVIRSQGRMLAEWESDTRALQGVELTHTQPAKIAKLAKLARSLGAQVIVMHGETPSEPVAAGTNAAAVRCPDIDILAHPGKITFEDAQKARDNGIHLELSARRGHNATNAHVAKVALETKANLLVNSDMHAPDDLIDQKKAHDICLKARLSESQAQVVIKTNPIEFLRRLK
jgi:histidinol phosphatase-like PHP family hydrolase